MLSQLSLDLFDIHGNPADGYGFHILSVGYSVTNGFTSRKNKPLLSINFRKDKYFLPAYDKTVWLCLFGIGKMFYISRYRPIRDDKVPYAEWYIEAKKHVEEITGYINYYESYATRHYYQDLTPLAAAERYDIEF